MDEIRLDSDLGFLTVVLVYNSVSVSVLYSICLCNGGSLFYLVNTDWISYFWK